MLRVNQPTYGVDLRRLNRLFHGHRGMMVGIRLAIIDFPEPGGPSIRRL